MILLGVLSDNVDAVKVPGMVLGFKLEDTSRAVANLGKLELVVGFALKQDPRFDGCFKRTKVGDNEYLVLTLKGDMVPWDQVPLEKFRRLETEPGSVDKLVAKIKKESLVVALGLRGDYLLLAVGSSTDVLARLGQGTSLAERPEMAPLAKFADKRNRLDRLHQPGVCPGGQRQRAEHRRSVGVRRAGASPGRLDERATGGNPQGRDGAGRGHQADHSRPRRDDVAGLPDRPGRRGLHVQLGRAAGPGRRASPWDSWSTSAARRSWPSSRGARCPSTAMTGSSIGSASATATSRNTDCRK